jgi:hypothetical protein
MALSKLPADLASAGGSRLQPALLNGVHYEYAYLTQQSANPGE